MKRIKLKPLTVIDPESIPTNLRKEYKFKGTPEQFRELLSKVTAMANDVGGFTGVKKNNDPVLIMQKVTGSLTGEHFAFPEFDPVLVYFNLALKNIEEARNRKQLFTNTNSMDADTKYFRFIDFFESASNAVANLMQTLEAFFNRLMPDNLSVTVGNKTYNKEKIERMSFDWKLEHELPVITNHDFQAIHPDETAEILKLKELRNRLIHLKVIKKENLTSYQQLSEDLFNTDFAPYVNAIRVFIDTYSPGLIEEE
jgi:hypothetical protein